MSDSSDDEIYEPSANVGISEYYFTRGLKGRLTTTHSNPRRLQEVDLKLYQKS